MMDTIYESLIQTRQLLTDYYNYTILYSIISFKFLLLSSVILKLVHLSLIVFLFLSLCYSVLFLSYFHKLISATDISLYHLFHVMCFLFLVDWSYLCFVTFFHQGTGL